MLLGTALEKNQEPSVEMTTWNTPRVLVTQRDPDVAERGPDPMKLCNRLGVMLGDHLSRLIPEIQLETRNMALGDGCQHGRLVVLYANILAPHNLFQTVNGDTKWMALKFKYPTIHSDSFLAISYDDDDGDEDDNNFIT